MSIEFTTSTITIKGKTIPVSGEPGVDLKIAINSTNFQDWKKNVESDSMLDVRRVHFQSVDMFGPRVGFAKFKSDTFIEGLDHPLPGIVFSRGGSVAVLVILECEGIEYTLFCLQPRIPLGTSSFLEPPAGMLDGEGDFAGVCAKELAEEADIHIDKHQLIDMTQMAYGKNVPGMQTMCGASDEYIRMFLYRQTVSPEELRSMEGKHTGELDAGETITLKICKLSEVWKLSPDSKTLGLLHLYSKLTEEGKISRNISENNDDKVGEIIIYSIISLVLGYCIAYLTV